MRSLQTRPVEAFVVYLRDPSGESKTAIKLPGTIMASSQGEAFAEAARRHGRYTELLVLPAAEIVLEEPEAPVIETRWYVIEGDDHERRAVEALAESDALEEVALGFEAQYGEYDPALLTVVGVFDTEDEAQEEADR
jgi:hypothetical protein